MASSEQCGQTRGVVEAMKLPYTDVRRLAEEHRLTAAITDAHQQLDRHERQTATTRRRVEAPEQELQNLREDPASH